MSGDQDSDTVARNTVYNWSTRATGGLVATHALVRYLATFCELDVLALDDMPERAHLYSGGAPIADSWDGLKVVRGPKKLFAKALDALTVDNYDVVTAATVEEEAAAAAIFAKSADAYDDEPRPLSAAARTLGLMNEAWDVCIATQMEHVKFALEHVAARHKLCPVHDQHSLPWGPWPPCASKAKVDADVAEECKQSSLDFLRCTLLCTSDYVKRAVDRHAHAGQRAVCCYGADYAAYGGVDLPRYDLSKALAFRGKALDASLCQQLYRAAGNRSSGDCTNIFATLISPCAAKGAAIVAEMAKACPDVPFLCVSTRWTRDTEAEVALLKSLPNVVFASGVPSERMDQQIWSKTKILLAPSVWPEPFGLVAVEAALRGIPVITTDLAGLKESNVAGTALRCPLLMDIHAQKTFYCSAPGDAVAAFEALSDDQRDALRAGKKTGPFQVATPAHVTKASQPFAARLRDLSDPTALARAAAAAHAAAKAHIKTRQHTIAKLLRTLDDRPPWVRTPVDGVGGPEAGDCNRVRPPKIAG